MSEQIIKQFKEQYKRKYYKSLVQQEVFSYLRLIIEKCVRPGGRTSESITSKGKVLNWKTYTLIDAEVKMTEKSREKLVW